MKKTLLRDRKVDSDMESEDDSTSMNSSEQSSDSAVSSEDEKKKATKKVKANKNKKRKSTKPTQAIAGLEQFVSLLAGQMKPNTTAPAVDGLPEPLTPSGSIPPPPALNANDIAAQVVALLKQQEEQPDGKKKAPGKVGSKVAFKRIDQVYDRKTHNYKLKETVQSDEKTDQWDQVCPCCAHQPWANTSSMSSTFDGNSMPAADTFLPLSTSSRSTCENAWKRSWETSKEST